MHTTPPSNTNNQTPSNRDFLEVSFNKNTKVNDLLDTTDDTISINSSGK